MAYFVETFDNTVFGYAAPSIRAEWGLSLESVGLITSAVFTGMVIGAIFGGRLSDRYGRKTVLIWGSVLYSFASLLSAFAPNYEVLAASRVITGIGVQATTGVLMVYVSEMFPKLSRGRFFSALTFIGLSAGPVTSVLAVSLSQGTVGSWRWLFVIGAAGLVVALLAAFALPESIRWLLVVGKSDRAEASLIRLEARAVRITRAPLAEPGPDEPQKATKGTLRELLRPEYLKRLIVATIAWFGFLFVVYGYLSWVPTMLIEHGMTKTDSLTFASVLSLSSFVSPIILFPVADRLNRRTTILFASATAAISFVVFAGGANTTIMLISAFIAQTMLAVCSASFYTYIPEIMPTHIRGIGAGLVNGIGRIGGVFQGLLVPSIFAAIGFGGLYISLAVLVLLVGLIIGIFGEKTSRRTLEEIAGTTIHAPSIKPTHPSQSSQNAAR